MTLLDKWHNNKYFFIRCLSDLFVSPSYSYRALATVPFAVCKYSYCFYLALSLHSEVMAIGSNSLTLSQNWLTGSCSENLYSGLFNECVHVSIVLYNCVYFVLFCNCMFFNPAFGLQ